jgi:GNAT superfamily N-acetyltransferase
MFGATKKLALQPPGVGFRRPRMRQSAKRQDHRCKLAMKDASLEARFRPVEVATLDEDFGFCTAPGFPPLTKAVIERQRPDAMWILLDKSSRPAARCSLWWRHAPAHDAHRVGLIGHYAAKYGPSAAALLELACAQLAQRGCTLAVGPMDGNTWQNYRLVVERGSEPPFFLEPNHPDDWPDHFRAAGFFVLAGYYSALCTDLVRPDPGLADTARRLESQGVLVRPLRMDCLTRELHGIHALTLASFRDSFLFTPIGRDDFLAQYLELRSCVQPELVLIAEQGERMIGYVFALPDLSRKRPDTMIIKTLAVHPELHAAGAGRLLAGRCHQAAYELGYRRAIHALMLDTSAARNLSERIARPMRRYALFARRLEADR